MIYTSVVDLFSVTCNTLENTVVSWSVIYGRRNRVSQRMAGTFLNTYRLNINISQTEKEVGE